VEGGGVAMRLAPNITTGRRKVVVPGPDHTYWAAVEAVRKSRKYVVFDTEDLMFIYHLTWRRDWKRFVGDGMLVLRMTSTWCPCRSQGREPHKQWEIVEE
jgi:hypothetical protein